MTDPRCAGDPGPRGPWAARAVRVGLCLLALAAGCGSSDTAALDEAGGRDGAGPPTADEDLGDDAIDEPFLPGAPGGQGLRASPSAGLGSEFAGDVDGGSCFDDEDDDGDGRVDCDDPGCLGLRSCCVGDGACCSPVPDAPIPDAVDFAGCGDGAVDDCVPGPLDVFGPVPPVIAGGSLQPGGDLFGEGGVAFGDGAVDLRQHRVTVDVRFAGRTDAGCGTPCVEAAAVSIVPADKVRAASTTIRPAAGLRQVWDAGEVRLVIGATVVRSWPEGDDPGAHRWGLDLRPDGQVVVTRDGAALDGGQVPYTPPGPARLVVHGRNASAPDGAGAGVEALSTTVGLCDIPNAWTDATALPLLAASSTDASVVEPVAPLGPAVWPSLALDPARDLRGLAVAVDGAIWTALPDPAVGGDAWGVTSAVAVRPGDAGFDAFGAREPELVATGLGDWALLYVGEDAAGRTRIGRADAPDLEGPWTPRAVAVVVGGDDGSRQPENLDRPTVAVTLGGTWGLVLRVVDGDGSAALRAYGSLDGGESFQAVSSPDLDTMTRDVALDRVALVVHNGAWQLFVGRRDGARHRVDLLVSDDLIHWRLAARDILKDVSADGDEGDPLDLRSVDVAAGDDVIESVFVAQAADGTSVLGQATRRSPTLGRR